MNQEARSPTSRKNTRNGMLAKTCAAKVRGLFERFDRGCFVVFHVEDGVEFGDLKQIVDLLGEVQKLQFAALILRGRKGAHQLTDARAIDVVDVLEIQHDLLVAFG